MSGTRRHQTTLDPFDLGASGAVSIAHIVHSIGPYSFGLGAVAANLAAAQVSSGLSAEVWCLDNAEKMSWGCEQYGIVPNVVHCFRRVGPESFAFTPQMERAALDLNAKTSSSAASVEETKTQILDATRKLKTQQEVLDQLRDQVDRLQQQLLKQPSAEAPAAPSPAPTGSSGSSGSSGSVHKPWGSRSQ